MEYLYLDESGRFEGATPKTVKTLVGGFLSTSPPEAVATALGKLLEAVRGEELLHAKLGNVAANELHLLELYPKLQEEELLALRLHVLRTLRGLGGLRFVSTHYFADSEVSVGSSSDHEGPQRFLRMWRSTVRNVLHYQPQPGAGQLTLFSAQRSLPADVLEATVEARYLMHLPAAHVSGRGGYSIVSEGQIPQLLLGVLSRGTAAPFPRRFHHMAVGRSLQSISQRGIEKQPFLAGLLLSDMACDLIRHAASGAQDEAAVATRSCATFRIAYHPIWERYERLCEGASDSSHALEELVELSIAADLPDGTPEAWLQAAARTLLRSLFSAAQDAGALRDRLVAIAKRELDTKTGHYPRCALILGSGGLRRTREGGTHAFEEWICRTAYANHTGREAGASREAMITELQDSLASDVGAFLAHGESLAVFAVSLQDECSYDEAATLVEPWVKDSRKAYNAIAADRPGARWLIYGRTLSNLAQTYAYRQAEGDLERAAALLREARPHMQEQIDLSQWGCHALNLAGLLGEEELQRDALQVLYRTDKVSDLLEKLVEIRFGPETPTYHLFGFSALTRLAIKGRGVLAEALRERLTSPEIWETLFANIREVAHVHPVELYTRHLIELAPPSCAEQEEELLALSLAGFGNAPNQRVLNVLQAGSHAAYGLKLAARGETEKAQSQAGIALEVFRSPFKDEPWISMSTYSGDAGIGWFDAAVEGLVTSPRAEALKKFLGCFRYEWR